MVSQSPQCLGISGYSHLCGNITCSLWMVSLYMGLSASHLAQWNIIYGSRILLYHGIYGTLISLYHGSRFPLSLGISVVSQLCLALGISMVWSQPQYIGSDSQLWYSYGLNGQSLDWAYTLCNLIHNMLSLRYGHSDMYGGLNAVLWWVSCFYRSMLVAIFIYAYRIMSMVSGTYMVGASTRPTSL